MRYLLISSSGKFLTYQREDRILQTSRTRFSATFKRTEITPEQFFKAKWRIALPSEFVE